MTIKEIQKKLETLEKWELINFWRSLPYEDMWEIAKLFKKHPELNAKILSVSIRSYQFQTGDTVVFPNGESSLNLPAGTTGKITTIERCAVKKKPYRSKISVGLLINGTGYILTRTTRPKDKYLNDLFIHSIDGNWETL